MQALKDSFFYHSNTTLNSDRGFEDERQVLMEDQKMCKARARKFSLETNRRRKALEDRRKQWDVQEQRLRENILQQRKQKVQDATERFQRAHLPPSQRRRQSFKKGSPNIEDALNHIQGTLSPYARPSSFLSSSSTISRGCTPPPKPPPAPNPSRYQRTVSAVEAYTKLIQERSLNTFKNSQLLFLNELQEAHLSEKTSNSPQGQQMNPLINSESLSSLDSLENEDLNQKTIDLGCTSHSSLVQDSNKSRSVSKNQNGLRSSYDRISSKSFLGDENMFQRKQFFLSPEPRKEDRSAEIFERVHSPPQASRGPVSIEQSTKTEGQPSLSHLSTLCEIIDAIKEDSGESSQENSPRDQVTVVANNKKTPVNTPLQFACLPQEGKLDYSMPQKRIQEDVYPKHPSATEIFLSQKSNTNKDNVWEAPSMFDNVLVSDTNAATASHKEVTTDTTDPKPKHNNEAMNNLNKGSNADPKLDRSKNTECLHQACTSNIPSEIPKCLREESQVLLAPATLSNSDSKMNEIDGIKGILKKRSNYVPGDCRYRYSSGHMIFTKHIALSIRDSVELTRTKAKGEDPNKTVKKKLRWLDEAGTAEEHNELNTRLITKPGQIKSKPSNPELVDHQPSLTAVCGTPRAAPGVTSLASDGYHFTKQAWADVRVQDAQLPERGEEVKVQRGSSASGSATSGPRGHRRVRSARVGVGPVSSRARKGTVIRPQSASEASHAARSQARGMVPRPPPRTQQGNTREAPPTAENSGGSRSIAQPVDFQGANRDNTESYTSPYAHHVMRAASNVFFITEAQSGTGTKAGTPSSGYQETAAGKGGRQRLAYVDKGPCLDKTPTDDEISQLWHGVRSALATKDGDPRSSPAQNGSSSAMAQALANVSQLTINGDSLISAVKSEKITRMSGFFPSSSNVRSLRRQPAEGHGTRRRSGAELGRPSSGSDAHRRLPSAASQTAVQITPYTSRYDLTNRYEGPESAMAMTAQFQLLAQTHSQGTGAATAMETGQTQRKPGSGPLQGPGSWSGFGPGLGYQQQQQQQGHTALSLEEQKILLSLDKLNHRLHYVQEHVAQSSAPANVMADATTTGEGKASNPRKHRALSADGRNQTQKRY